VDQIALPRPDGADPGSSFPGVYHELAVSPGGESLYVTGWTEEDPVEQAQVAVLVKQPSGLGSPAGSWMRYRKRRGRRVDESSGSQ
jgi:hypothetical protein